MRAGAALGLVLLLAGASCTGRKKPPSGPGPIISLDTRVTGLSGLTRDGTGALWAVGELGDAALRIDPTTFAVEQYPVLGCPSKTDLEALTWMGDAHFAVGTETQEAGRAHDALLYGRIEGGRLVVGSTDTLDYSLWRLTASDNHGIEGLCHLDGVLMLATELIDQQRGRRWAPVAMLDLETQTWTAHRVGLTSKTGKLAALGCRVVDGTVVAIAVERHFGVSRLLRFDIPEGADGAWIEPRIVADLSKLIDPLPNFEGLVWDDDGSVVLLTDNEYRGVVREPSRLYFIPASALQ
ncbi:MAG: esterase-like activity of phytase family protein [Myxococcales bacterium]|nr:esterase-like activity of phytase family protein [Myxococcales bacterium]MDH3485528.1 esterase-like activity of phytase family protein [Myxococcales bacterium]